MPAISIGKVFITGTNGFIGAWTLKTFLDAGFSVRAAIRSDGKATHIKKQFSSFGDKLEFAIVPDIAKVKCSPPLMTKYQPHVTSIIGRRF